MVAMACDCSVFLVVRLLADCGLYDALDSRYSPPGPLWGSVIDGIWVAAG
jgi:hypothetical protein